MLECNLLNDNLSSPVYFAQCFISEVAEYYPTRKQISVDYIENILRWLKNLSGKQKEQFMKNLHFELSNYHMYEELPF